MAPTSRCSASLPARRAVTRRARPGRGAALHYAAFGIRINALCPGIIDTAMMDHFSGGTPEGRAAVVAQEPIGRMGTAEEIAAAVVWLCSDAASFMLGTRWSSTAPRLAREGERFA